MNLNPMMVIQQFPQIKARLLKQNPGMNPQDMVNQLVQSGKVSQQQFEEARNLANIISGMKF